MSRARITLSAAACAALTIAVVPALASDPSSGTVSNAAPTAEWTGSSNGYGYYPLHSIGQQGEPCQAPVCDTYTLTVADQATLTLTADNNTASGPGSDSVELDVVKPDGTIVYTESAADKPVVVKIKNAAKGDYELHVIVNEQAQNDGTYKASAVLGNGPAPVAPAATPAPAAPAPAPAPAQAAATLTLNTKKASAKKAKKGLKLSVSASSPVTDVVAKLLKGKKAIGSGKLARIDGTGSVSVKAKKLKKGTYTVALTAKDAGTGQAVGLQAKLKVVK
jgi:hypothetical protein